MVASDDSVFQLIVARLRASQAQWLWERVRSLELVIPVSEDTVRGVWDGYDNAIAEIELIRKEREAGGDETMDKRESQSAAGDGVKCENCGELITAAVYCPLCDKTLCYDCDAMVEHAEAHPI